MRENEIGRAPRKRRERQPTQLEVVRQVMCQAAQYEAWMTLAELARKTEFPEASISAQLRHLRKEEHGGWEVEKRKREWLEPFRTNGQERVWEYRLRT
ncbi:MAG TPA: hypothetical protein VMJ35_10025 [Dongiaceae bacterium]|nr:hypothetical protein [Dongiaceae bacterium]